MKATITGRHGFIGSALWERLEKMGWELYPYPRSDVDYMFLFGSPSSTVQYDKNMEHCFRETINNFIDAISFCRDHQIKLIYPSSATVYDKATPYAHCKACLEEIQEAFDTDTLGLRIFAGYGPGEGHKGGYASIVYQFCKAMKNGERPVIFGDGKQTRDFVCIDDIIDAIVANLDKRGTIDIGTGIDTPFNSVVGMINEQLGTDIKPIYVEKPIKYVEDTTCFKPLRKSVHLFEGIRRILDKIV